MTKSILIHFFTGLFILSIQGCSSTTNTKNKCNYSDAQYHDTNLNSSNYKQGITVSKKTRQPYWVRYCIFPDGKVHEIKFKEESTRMAGNYLKPIVVKVNRDYQLIQIELEGDELVRYNCKKPTRSNTPGKFTGKCDGEIKRHVIARKR